MTSTRRTGNKIKKQFVIIQIRGQQQTEGKIQNWHFLYNITIKLIFIGTKWKNIEK